MELIVVCPGCQTIYKWNEQSHLFIAENDINCLWEDKRGGHHLICNECPSGETLLGEYRHLPETLCIGDFITNGE